MSHTPYLLKNGSIVNEGSVFQGDITVRGGLIEKVFPNGCPDDLPQEQFRVIDLTGLFLLPGVIDDQVHFREPGFPGKANIASESRAAVAGGVTSFMEMPNTLPQTVTQDLLEAKFRLAQEKSLANYSFYMGATNDNLAELRVSDPSLVCGIKVFMGSSTGNMLVDNRAALEAIFREIRLPIAVHCEDEHTVRSNLDAAVKMFGNDIPIHMHALIRSHEACERSSRLAVSLAEKYDARLHLLHISTLNETRFLRNDQPLADKRITAEVCIHHLWFDMDDYQEKGTRIKWNPSIKFGSDRIGLINGIKDGYIDVLATDHAPHTLEEKDRPYNNCPSGGPMVQHGLQAMVTLAGKHNIGMEKVVELMCHNPAICFGIRNRGFIREGYAADLVVIDPGKPHTVSAKNIHYHCGWSPLENSTLDATIMYTFVNGFIVYHEGDFAEDVRGQALDFDR